MPYRGPIGALLGALHGLMWGFIFGCGLFFVPGGGPTKIFFTSTDQAPFAKKDGWLPSNIGMYWLLSVFDTFLDVRARARKLF